MKDHNNRYSRYFTKHQRKMPMRGSSAPYLIIGSGMTVLVAFSSMSSHWNAQQIKSASQGQTIEKISAKHNSEK